MLSRIMVYATTLVASFLVLYATMVMGFQLTQQAPTLVTDTIVNELSSSSSVSSTSVHVQKSDCPFRLDTCIERRTALQKPIIDATKMIPFCTIAMLSTSSAMAAVAADSSSTSTSTATTDATGTKNALINQLLDQLRGIPTFCIVSNSTGAAYMIYKRDLNMGIGYAFLTYDGAVTVLNEAKQNAIQKGYSNVWTNATITTIPLDVAIRLTLKKRNRIAINNRNDTNKVQSLDTLLQIIPGADERFDGIAIDKERFQHQGRVPLFYVWNNNYDDNLDEASKKTVFYLNRKDLIRDRTKSQVTNTTLPNIGAIDLIGIFESLLLGRNVASSGSNLLFPTTSTTSTQPIRVEFVGNVENMVVAKALRKNGDLTPYNPNQMIL